MWKARTGLALFIQAIPFNFYALLTIAMMIGLAVMKIDYGPMELHERNALRGDLYTTPDRPYATEGAGSDESQRQSGGSADPHPRSDHLLHRRHAVHRRAFFSGTSLVDAFAGSNASVGLMLGSFLALVITVILFMIRRGADL